MEGHRTMDPGAVDCAWRDRLRELDRRIRSAARSALAGATGDPESELTRVVGRGVGDATFGLDRVTERVVDAWLDEVARERALSVLTEDVGWRHRGPRPGGSGELPGFDHGGPRLAFDPVDGTRNLMHDVRSAWTVLALAGPGTGAPRLAEVELAVVGELPDSRAALARILVARRGAGCRILQERLTDGAVVAETGLHADADARVDHGYFPFFAFHPESRTEIARLAASFFEHIAREEGADVATCFDDQYIASAGQLVLAATGTYRMVVDARGLLGERGGPRTQACKPYDVAGAVLCAREAGAVVLDLAGRQLDTPLDTATPVSFCAFANEATRARLWPVLARCLERFPVGP